MTQGQERDRVKELSYDYVNDEEDSTNDKMGSKKAFLEVDIIIGNHVPKAH